MEDSITVIILGFNDLKWLSKCIDSVLNSSYSNLRVMYVDNASTDGSVDFVRNCFPDVEVVSSAVNLGYAAGNNLGIERAMTSASEFFVLLNSDTWVEASWLERLVKIFREEPDVGAVTASIRLYDGNEADQSYRQILQETPEFILDAVLGEKKAWYSTGSGSGAALMVSRRFVQKVGGIDPLFFMYYEEIDWLRRGRQHGFKTVVSTDAIVHHFNHLLDPGEKRPAKRRAERGYFIYLLKEPSEPVIKSVAKFLLEGPSRIVGAISNRQFKRAWHLIVDFGEILLKLPLVLRRRHSETRLDVGSRELGL